VIVPTVVLLLSSAVVLVGGGAELRDTLRAGRTRSRTPVPASGPEQRAPAGQEPEAEARAAADVGRWPMLAWFGLAAFSVLAAASVADRRPDIDDLTLVVFVLGFAGDRAYYLARRHSGDDRALRGEIIACVVGAIGLLVGFAF
jgi:hypothetical protein